MKQYICIDIGGTEIKHGVLDENEKFLAKGKVPTEAFKGGPALLKKVMGIAADYLKDRKTEGICVSTAGMVDVEKGEIDVNCAGLAEAVSGAAAGAQSALCLTVGTGIGGCIIIGGRVYHGWSGSACEVGYMHMDGSDFQTLGAASILVKRVAAAKGEPEAQWNGYRIFQLAGEGDSICVEAIDQMCDCLGKGISNICYVLNPQIVVLGGGIMAQEAYLRPRLEKALARYLVSSIYEKTELAFARHQNDAGMRGAYYHFLERQGKARS